MGIRLAAMRTAAMSEGGSCFGKLLSGLTEESRVSACCLDSDGKFREYDMMRLSELAHHHWPDLQSSRLLYRKLRHLNDDTKTNAMVRVDPEMVFVRADFVRAVVEPDRVLFLGIEDPTFQSFLIEMCDTMLTMKDQLQHSSFDLLVLECIACATMALHKYRFEVMKSVATNVLNNIKIGSPEDAVLRLYPVKKALGSFLEQIRPLANCLKHEIEQVPDVAPTGRGAAFSTGAQSLRHRRYVGSAHGGSMVSCTGEECAGADKVSFKDAEEIGFSMDHKEGKLNRNGSQGDITYASDLDAVSMEDILDDWAHSAGVLSKEALELSASLEEAIKFLDASMSCLRNRLLQFELIADVCGVALLPGTVISGIFGMNMGLPETLQAGTTDATWWYAIITLILVVGALISASALFVVRRGRREWSNNAAAYGNNKFFTSFGSNDYILRLVNGGHDVAINGALKDLLTPCTPDLLSDPDAEHYLQSRRGMNSTQAIQNGSYRSSSLCSRAGSAEPSSAHWDKAQLMAQRPLLD